MAENRRAFTLIELLVVIAIVVLLVAIMVPALASAKETARRTVCLANLSQIGVAIQSYAGEYAGRIPYGPKAPPFLSPADLYPSTGAVTSLISLVDGSPAGLGLMLTDQLSREPKALFCPSSDVPEDAAAELANVGITQAQCGYYYRHASGCAMFDNPNVASVPPDHIVLADLGLNRNGLPIRALAIDTQFLCAPAFAAFDVKSRTHHNQKFADILFSDGHAAPSSNADGRFTVDLSDYNDLPNAFSMILGVMEAADRE